MTILQQIRRATLTRWRPPPRRTVAEWAEAHRRLPEETSPIPGRWRNATMPYLVEPMQLASPSHPCRRVTLINQAPAAWKESG